LKLLYYGTTQAATTNGIYGSLANLQTQITATQSGINVHETVKMATTGALGTSGNLVGGTITTTYANGTADASGGTGVGATLTIATSSNWSAITIDGQSLVVGNRVIIKDQATSLQNGIYTVTSVGAVGNTTSFVFTRATDSDNHIAGEFAEGDFAFVSAGTTNGNTSWVLTSASPTGTSGPVGTVRIGTDPVTYIQFGSVTFGSQTANTIFAAPSGSSGTPTFRQLASADFAAGGSLGQVPYLIPAGTGWSWLTPMPTSGGNFTGAVYNLQPTPIAFTATTNTMTAAQMLSGIITVTQTAATTVTFPTGGTIEAGWGALTTNASIDLSIINLGTSSGAVTVAANSNSFTGSTSIPIGTSARFRIVRNSVNAYTIYRI
jgi:hypothetical protein